MRGFRPGSARVVRLDDDQRPVGEPMTVDAVVLKADDEAAIDRMNAALQAAYDDAVAGEEPRFDPYDAEVMTLMLDRAARQGVQLGSTRAGDEGLLVDAEPPEQRRRATRSIAEMRQRTREHYDPFGLGDHDDEPVTVGDAAVYGYWTAGGRLVLPAEAVDRLAPLFQTLTVCANHASAILDAYALAEPEQEEPPVERRRHGHAAVCPRHGPTKGGLCRRCSR